MSYVDDVDLLARLSGYGDLTSAVKNLLLGFNHRNFGGPVPFNAENHGLTFFTRPRFNLSYDNVAIDRILTPLLTQDVNTYQRAIRCILDPESGRGRITNTGTKRMSAVTSALFDTRHAFIPLLSNTLISMSGWPDPTMDFFDSTPGVTREVVSMADGLIEMRHAWQMTANFRNIIGDPITLLFHVWLRYIANVRSGLMTPWPEEIVENRMDYNTAIWRLTLDRGRRYIQKIARTIATPAAVPLGASMDFSTDTPLNMSNASQISIPFQCNGAEYNDPILMTEFNLMVVAFNPDMHPSARSTSMRKLNYDEINYFNTYGFPFINVLTNELTWWVYKTDYDELLQSLKSNHQSLYPNRETN